MRGTWPDWQQLQGSFNEQKLDEIVPTDCCKNIMSEMHFSILQRIGVTRYEKRNDDRSKLRKRA